MKVEACRGECPGLFGVEAPATLVPFTSGVRVGHPGLEYNAEGVRG